MPIFVRRLSAEIGNRMVCKQLAGALKILLKHQQRTFAAENGPTTAYPLAKYSAAARSSSDLLMNGGRPSYLPMDIKMLQMSAG